MYLFSKMSRSSAVKSAPTVVVNKANVVEIPEALMNGLGTELKSIIENGDSGVPTDALDLLLLDSLEQIVEGSLKASQLVALLKEVGMTSAHKSANGSVVNVLWLYGTQVSGDVQFTLEFSHHAS